MISITHNSFDGKLFHLMNEKELLYSIACIKDMYCFYRLSLNKNQKEYWSAYQNCLCNLNKF